MDGTSSRCPSVSVCLPSYNYARFLPDCLAGVLAQTLPEWELVVVDDASTDDSWKVLGDLTPPPSQGRRSVAGRIATRGGRSGLHRHEAHCGAVATWNHCLQLARAPYVAFLCADDLAYPARLERLVDALEATPSAVLAHADGDWLDAGGCPTERFSAVFPAAIRAHLSADHVSPGSQELRRLAAGYNYVHLSGAVFRREAALQAGGFDARYPYAADWDLWLRLLAAGDVAYVAEPLSGYRRHAGNLTLQMQATGQEFRDWYGVAEAAFRRWPADAGDPRPIRREARRVIREHLLRRVHADYAAGRRAEVRRDLRLAFREDPALLADPLTVLTFLKCALGIGRLPSAARGPA